jgi:hypothetical protein
MNNFTSGLNTQIVRTAAGSSYLAPSNNEKASDALAALGKVNAFISRFKNTNGFSEYHPGLIAITMTNVQSLVTGESLSATRGYGRVSTVTDHILSNGCGMARAGQAICDLFELQVTWVKDTRTGITYPMVENGLPKSNRIMKELKFVLSERSKFADDLVIRKSTRDRLLLKSNWNDSRLIGYTIELLGRAFAYQMDSEVRTALVKGDNHTSLKAAMDTLRFAPS